MSDMFGTINAHADAVRAAREADAAKQRRQRKADRVLRIRAISAAIIVAVLGLLGGLGLVSWWLAIFLILVTDVWLAIWFGAWLQYSLAEGGLLRVRIK